jgi:hypothetical protein
MRQTKYLNSLPAVQYSPILFFVGVEPLMVYKIEKGCSPLNYNQFRQLVSLYFLGKHNRKGCTGIAEWFRSTHLGISNYKARKEVFNNNIQVLQALGYISIYEVQNGRNAQVTPEGELFITELETSLKSYYLNFYQTYNLSEI